MLRLLRLLVVLAVAAVTVLAAGCGSGPSGVSRGRLTASVQFPERVVPAQVGGRVVPEGADLVVVVVRTPSGDELGSVELERTLPPQPISATPGGAAVQPAEGVSGTIANLPLGPAVVQADAYPDSGPVAAGTRAAQRPPSLARAVTQVNIGPGDNRLEMALESRAAVVEVTPGAAAVKVGDWQQFLATAKDEDGAILLGATFDWTCLHPAYAQVDANGLAEGLSPGVATIEARERASAIAGQAQLTVEPRVGDCGGQSGFWGYVTDQGGAPVADVLVGCSDGQTLWMTTSAQDGSYQMTGIPLGARVLSFDKDGYETTHVASAIANATDCVRVDAVLATSAVQCPNDLPQFSLNPPSVDQVAGNATISGVISNLDSGTAVLVLNGSETIIPVAGNGSFSALVFLNTGQNAIVIRASNCRGNALSTPMYVQFTGQFVFRVTLTWDVATDMDLHLWAPGSAGGTQHCCYWNMSVDAGGLDIDDTYGYGPENFTADTIVPGRYAVAVNYYSGSPSVGCSIRVTVPGQPATDFGPYALTLSNYESDYPVSVSTPSWWRATDLQVAANGDVTIVPADTSVPYAAALGGLLPRQLRELKNR